MKLIIYLCAAVAAVTAGTKEEFQLGPESLNRMQNFAMPCIQEFNVDPSYMHKLGDENLPRDEVTNKFLHCFGVNSGIVDKDGHMVVDRLVGIIGEDHPLVGEMKEAIKKCNEITKEDPVATTVAMHVCYGEIFPVRFLF